MSRKYKLLRDLPDGEAGDIYEVPKFGSHNWYVSKSNSCFHAATVEDNPSWFEEVKEGNELSDKIVYATPGKDAYDSPNLNKFTNDEPGQWAEPKPEEVKGKNWEILEMYNNVDGSHAYHKHRSTSKDIILTVRRLSDGEVFTVGQEVDFRESDECEWENFGKILSFNVVDGDLIPEIYPDGETNATGSICRDFSDIRHHNQAVQEYIKYVEEENRKSPGWMIESVEFKGKIYPHEYWGISKTPNHGFNGNSYGYFIASKIRPNYFSIHSVRRLSDGEVFTVGDLCGSVERTDGYPNKKIKKFFFPNNDDNLYVQFDEGYGNNDGCLSIKQIRKVQSPQPKQKERIEVVRLGHDSTTHTLIKGKLYNPAYNYLFSTTHKIPDGYIPCIQGAIESCLNDEPTSCQAIPDAALEELWEAIDHWKNKYMDLKTKK